MTRHLHPALVALVAILAVMAIGTAGCGEASGSSAARDGELIATVEAIWKAAGIDPANAFLGGYDRQTRENSKACQHIPKEDRWYAVRVGRLPSNVAAQDQIYNGALTYLERAGYTVERYEDRAPELHEQALRATKADVAVLMTVAEDGNTWVRVSVGPCAVPLATFSADMYKRAK